MDRKFKDLVVTNSRRLEQAQLAIKKRDFQRAKSIFISIRASLNNFEDNAKLKDLRKEIRKQRRLLALEGKIQDMDNFMTHMKYEAIKDQLLRLYNEKQYKSALQETSDFLFLLRTIDIKYQKYDLPEPSQLDDQRSEVYKLYQKLLRYKPDEK